MVPNKMNNKKPSPKEASKTPVKESTSSSDKGQKPSNRLPKGSLDPIKTHNKYGSLSDDDDLDMDTGPPSPPPVSKSKFRGLINQT